METVDTKSLQDRDFTLIVDKSGSMGFNTDTHSGASRWKAAQEATLGLTAKISELDKDGITFYAFNSTFKRHDNVTPQIVADLWKEHEPNGGTELASVLKDALNSYFTRKAAGNVKPNGESFLVVTDGEPEDKAKVAQVIVDATKKMDRDGELEITFIQVGKDAEATTFLKFLDDGLKGKGAKYDIVDTLTIDEMGTKSLTEVLLASINEHHQ